MFLFVVYLPRFFRVFVGLIKDRRVPPTPKIAVAAAVLYGILPVDIVPDWHVPLFGFIEDLLLLYLALRWLVRSTPKAVLSEHVARSGRIS